MQTSEYWEYCYAVSIKLRFFFSFAVYLVSLCATHEHEIFCHLIQYLAAT